MNRRVFDPADPSPAARDAQAIHLLCDGKVRFEIFRLPWQSAERLLDPADELVHYLERSFEATIPSGVPSKGAPSPRQAGHVRLCLRLDVRASLDREAFEIVAQRGLVEIRGRTVEAVSHGVYYFLDRWIGVRWLWPGSTGEVVPHHRDLSIPIGRWRESPAYRWRQVHTGGAVDQAMDIATMLHAVLRLPLSYQHEFNRWCRRNRLGGLRVIDGHRWSEIAPPEVHGGDAPEYYALINGERDARPHDGKHGNQPCLTNETVQRMMEGYASACVSADPAIDAVSIALNDGGSPCECADCLARGDTHDTWTVQQPDSLEDATHETGGLPPRSKPALTDQLIFHANQVAEGFARRWPGKKLLILLYSYYGLPPTHQKLSPHVIGQSCVMASSFWHEPTRRTRTERLRKIAAAVPELGIYEYYANGNWPAVHRLFPELIASSVRDFHALGARYFSTQPPTGFAINGLNLYVLARCLWDIHTDPKDVIGDYCRSGFGDAAPVIESYFSAWMNRWRETESGSTLDAVPRMPGGLPNLSIGLLYPPSFLAAREAELKEAGQRALRDNVVQSRLHWLAKGLDYTRCYAEACRLSLNLLRLARLDEHQLPLMPDEPEQASLVLAAAQEAQTAWDRYWEAARLYLGQFVYDDFWAHYRTGPFGEKDQLLQRIGDLLRQLRGAAGEDGTGAGSLQARRIVSLTGSPRIEGSSPVAPEPLGQSSIRPAGTPLEQPT